MSFPNIDFDYQILLEVQRWHTPFLNSFFKYFTNLYGWIPLYIYLIWACFRLNLSLKNRIFVLVFFISGILLADYIASGLFKPYFQRFRPCHDPILADKLQLINPCGGLYGFASSHASTAMALCFGYFFFIKPKPIFKKILLGWALLMGFSRLYLGLHFLTDILTGFIIGIISAVFIFVLYSKSKLYFNKS